MPPTLTTKSSDLTAPHFAIITKALAGGKDDVGRRRFNAVASSTITDRQGDEISLKALQQMAAKFREGVTIFLDHKNEALNAFGTTDSAEIVEGGIDPKTGTRIWDLKIAGGVNEPNPNAIQLHDSITGGYVKLGCSIDAFVTDHKPKQAGRYDIDGLDVFAASIVGVPANQRSWAQKAVRAIKSFYGEPEEEDVNEGVEVVDGQTATLTVEADGTSTVEVTKAEPEVAELDPVAELAELEDELATVHAWRVHVGGDASDDTISKASEPDADDTCPTCGKGRSGGGDCSNAYHSAEKSAEVEGVQESAQETPETAPIAAAEAEPLDEKAAGVATEDVHALMSHVERLVKEIGFLRSENERLVAKNKELEAANKTVYGEVELAKQVIEKVMEKPLRAQTAAYVESFVDVHKLFDPDIADYLAKRGD